VGSGEKIVVCTGEGEIYLVDGYSFREERLFDFYGEVVDVRVVD
jgi:hypothetical protein